MAIDPAAISATPPTTRQPRGQREGHGEAIGHADDDITNEQAGGEVFFDVWR
jgi:hypothetical protein